MSSSIILRIFPLSFLIFSILARDIIKRDAPDGELYVYSTLDGCFPVESEEPCHINWDLPSFFAKSYEGHNKIVEGTLNFMVNGGTVDENCKEAVNVVLCSQVTPRCSKNSSLDYGNTTPLCEKVKEFCPQDVANKVCEDIFTGKHSKSKCVYPSKPIEGICPQPKYKLPSNELHDYQKISKQFTELFTNLEKLPGDQSLFSQECLSKMKEIFCINLVCSTDEKRLLIKRDDDDCYQVVRTCFGNTTTFLPSQLTTIINNLQELVEAHCKIYPKRNAAETESRPPTMQPSSSAAVIAIHLSFCSFSIIFSLFLR